MVWSLHNTDGMFVSVAGPRHSSRKYDKRFSEEEEKTQLMILELEIHFSYSK